MHCSLTHWSVGGIPEVCCMSSDKAVHSFCCECSAHVCGFSTTTFLCLCVCVCAAGVGSFVCRVCGASYGSSVALSLHMPKHRGLTTCPLCGLVSSRVSNLRSHLVRVHHLSEAEMECFVPRRNTWAQTAQRAAFSESSATSGFQQQQHQHSQAPSHRDLL